MHSDYSFILHFHAQIEICRDEIGYCNIIRVHIQFKAAKAVK